MKLKSQILFADIEHETLGMPVGKGSDTFSGFIKVNDTAKDILKFLEEDLTMDELVHKMGELYDVQEEKLREDVQNVVDLLDSKGLIQK